MIYVNMKAFSFPGLSKNSKWIYFMELMSSKMYSSPVCCVKQSPSSMMLSSLKGTAFVSSVHLETATGTSQWKDRLRQAHFLRAGDK